MDRLAIFEVLQRIKSSVDVAEWFLSNEPDDIKVVAELIGRSEIIEGRLAEIRGRLAGNDLTAGGIDGGAANLSASPTDEGNECSAPSAVEESGVHRLSVHVIGDRPTGDAA